MIDGTYSIEADSPLGRKRGTVSIRTEGSAAVADIDAPVVGKLRIEGRASGNSFTAEGAFKLRFVGRVAYSLRAEVSGDDLRVSIESSKGHHELSGTRV